MTRTCRGGRRQIFSWLLLLLHVHIVRPSTCRAVESTACARACGRWWDVEVIRRKTFQFIRLLVRFFEGLTVLPQT